MDFLLLDYLLGHGKRSIARLKDLTAGEQRKTLPQ